MKIVAAGGIPKPIPNHVAVAAPRARRKLDASRLPQPDAIFSFSPLCQYGVCP